MSGNLKKLFGTDQSLEVSGITLDYGEIQIRIARAGGANKRYAKVLEKLSRPMRRAIETETITRKASDKILHRVYAETVVLGWEGVKDDDGNEIAFSVEACIKFFEDLPDFFTDIRQQADKSALFRVMELEEDSKN